MREIKFLDLFAGVGGMRLALEKSAFYNKKSTRCVLTSEINQRCIDVYNNNFFDNKILRDIKTLNKKNIKKIVPDHDFLLAGFPCQPFSNAGVVKRKSLNRKHGFSDKKQGNLIFNVIDILKIKKPSVFLLENVKNLVSHNRGKTLKIILKELRKNYYVPNPKILNARDFGLPQNRERVFIVGFKERRNSEFNYPIPKKNKTLISKILEKKVCESYTISDKLWRGHVKRRENNRKKGKGFGFKLSKPNDSYTRAITSRYGKDGSECLLYQGKNLNPRFLTPRECFRLQGFPANFKISKFKTHAYIQAGNAVPINVVKNIFDEIFNYQFKNPTKLLKKNAA